MVLKNGAVFPQLLFCVALVGLQFNNQVFAAKGYLKRVQRSYNGTVTSSPSLAMVMESSPYYNWNYIFTALILSDTCAVSRARGIVNDTYPPNLITGLYRTIFIPRPGCDIQYHVSNIQLNAPAFDFPSRQHDISMMQVKRKMKLDYDGVCGGTPVQAAWVSCDEYGPPVNYKDCFFTSYGLTYSLADGSSTPLAPEDIAPTKSQIKVLSKEECEQRRLFQEPNATVFLHSKDEMCVSTNENHSPTCDEDWNGAVFCKYWKTPESDEYYDPYDHSRENDFEKYVAIGHRVYGFGQLFCQADSAALILKFGSQTYRQLFRTCGFTCSTTLPRGYRCQGNPPAHLGPVYCIPEKVPVHSYGHNNYNGYL